MPPDMQSFFANPTKLHRFGDGKNAHTWHNENEVMKVCRAFCAVFALLLESSIRWSHRTQKGDCLP